MLIDLRTTVLAAITMLVVSTGSAQTSTPSDGKAWLHLPTAEQSACPWQELWPSDFYPVSERNLASAIRELDRTSFVPLSASEAKRLVGATYENRRGRKPYLIRALYAFHGTGQYSLSRCKDFLIVSHGSLGSQFECHKDALVVNLAFKPAELFTSVSVAK